MEVEYFRKLMDDYNKIRFFSEEEYQSVFRKVTFKKYPKNSILKRKDDADICSRYICDGYIGLYDASTNRNKLKLIFGPTDTVFDKKGFRQGHPTSNVIKTISDAIIFEFSKTSEISLFEINKEFCLLALEVSHRITQRIYEQNEMKRLGFKESIFNLMNKYPQIEKLITNQDLADYFNTSLRSIERYKGEILRSENLFPTK